MKYIAIEIQNGTATPWAYDDLGTAQNKYFTILASASVSDVEHHGAILLDNAHGMLEQRFFNREATKST